MRKVSLHERPVTNSLAYLLCQEAKRATDHRPGMTPEDVRAVSNNMPDIRDIGTIPIAHTTAPQPHGGISTATGFAVLWDPFSDRQSMD